MGKARIKEKVLAPKRSGVQEIVIPLDSQPNVLEDEMDLLSPVPVSRRVLLSAQMA